MRKVVVLPTGRGRGRGQYITLHPSQTKKEKKEVALVSVSLGECKVNFIPLPS